MTFSELLLALEHRLPATILNGDAAATLDAARKGTHQHALAPIRLEYMKDDAPVEGFRLVEKIVHAIDGAFNDEALRLKTEKTPQ